MSVDPYGILICPGERTILVKSVIREGLSSRITSFCESSSSNFLNISPCLCVAHRWKWIEATTWDGWHQDGTRALLQRFSAPLPFSSPWRYSLSCGWDCPGEVKATVASGLRVSSAVMNGRRRLSTHVLPIGRTMHWLCWSQGLRASLALMSLWRWRSVVMASWDWTTSIHTMRSLWNEHAKSFSTSTVYLSSKETSTTSSSLRACLRLSNSHTSCT